MPFSKLESRLDAEYYRPDYLETARILESIPTTVISELCEMSTLRFDSSKKPTEIIRYIEIENVDTETGVTRPQLLCALEAPSRARKLVRTGDVIISTVRPERNAVALIDETLDGCVCSTGFCVLVPKAVSPLFLFCFLKSRLAIEQLVRKTMSSMYPAVSDTDILSLRIPTNVVGGLVEEISALIEDAKALQQQSVTKFQEAQRKLNEALNDALSAGKKIVHE